MVYDLWMIEIPKKEWQIPDKLRILVRTSCVSTINGNTGKRLITHIYPKFFSFEETLAGVHYKLFEFNRHFFEDKYKGLKDMPSK